jgi:predicted ribosomally synthesized peptide with nif11-like leader
MSLQQLEAFLARALGDPSLEGPLATAPNAAAVAAIAQASGFAITEADLLAAAGESVEVLEGIAILAAPEDAPPSELEAFLQQVEVDPDLQRVLAAAPDAEGVAALARVAGYGVTANDLWEASDEEPAVFELVSYGVERMIGVDAVNVERIPAPMATAADGAAEADGIAEEEMAPLEPEPPLALEAFLRQAELDPALQEALITAADAGAVAEIARAAGFAVTEADLWEASDETPHALQDPPPTSELEDPWEMGRPER